MLFTSPLALLALGLLPVLAAIYWFRHRSRPAVVSNLALWADRRSPRQGGRVLHRMQTPLTFFLELLILATLVLGAAGPNVRTRDLVRPLIVILDDSYSMRAQLDEQSGSPRRRAVEALRNELAGNRYQVRLVLVGPQPRVLGQSQRDASRVEELLQGWTCQSPTADLEAALAFAAALGQSTTRLLVVTDHPPGLALDSGQTEWWAFGLPLPNVAFTAAARTPSGDQQRVLLEVANLSESLYSGSWTIAGGNLSAPRTSRLELAARARRQFFLDLPPGSPAIEATLASDALAIDNHVVLLPTRDAPLRVSVELSEPNLRQSVVAALSATGQVMLTTDAAELLISDRAGPPAGEAWRVDLVGGKEVSAYAGPFVIDRNHRLTTGLSLANTVWSASSTRELPGTPIIMAGNVPLLAVDEDPSRPVRIAMRLAADRSTLPQTPDWPILFSNLVQWGRESRTGIADPNARLGQAVRVVLPRAAKEVEILAPSGVSRKQNARGHTVSVPADEVGIYTVRAANVPYRFSSNTLSSDESNLTGCETGRWGDWNRSATWQDRQTSIAWGFLLFALTIFLVHLVVIARPGRGQLA